jgi:hypothetical protein
MLFARADGNGGRAETLDLSWALANRRAALLLTKAPIIRFVYWPRRSWLCLSASRWSALSVFSTSAPLTRRSVKPN